MERGRSVGGRGVMPGVLLALLLALAAWLFADPPPQAAPPPDLTAYPWLFLRDGEPLAEGERLAEVLLVGDVMLGRAVAEEPDPLREVAPWLRAADLTVGNLESPILAGGDAPAAPTSSASSAQPILLRAPLTALATLTEAGFDVLGQANNHALDGGPAGLEESVGHLRAAGIQSVGAGATLDQAYEPLLVEVNGVRLAFLAFNAVPPHATGAGWQPARWGRERATAAIRAARGQADAVIVLAHWGYEYDQRVDPSQRRAAAAMWEAGAALVVGAHPHVVQGTAADERHFVAYSLGNFLFDQARPDTQRGLVLRAFFDAAGLRAVQALPVRAGLRPRLLPPDPPRLAFACDQTHCFPTEAEPDSTPGLFRAGPLDLTGDGVPEQVRRTSEQIVILQGGEVVWRGLATWRVVDMALGDPNDDGRKEVLLALWKKDKAGVWQSHPFILGYRGGVYRVLWGGSAVTEPIHEVELGDVDGDGREELVVLESAGEGTRRVAVWKWHGWGYSLFWRSPPGYYEDLRVRAGAAGSAIIRAVGCFRETE